MGDVSLLFGWFKFFSLVFRILLMMSVGMNFFWFSLFLLWLTFLDLHVCIFCQILEAFNHNFFKCSFSPTLFLLFSGIVMIPIWLCCYFPSDHRGCVHFHLQSIFSLVQIRGILLLCPQHHCFCSLLSLLCYSITKPIRHVFLFVFYIFSLISSLVLFYNFNFFADISSFLISFNRICDRMLKHFFMPALKSLSDNSNIWFILELLSFLIQIEIVLVISRMGDFPLYSWHFVCTERRLWVPLKFLTLAGSHLFMLCMQVLANFLVL